MMTAPTHTLILTKGVYLVSPEDAARVRSALDLRVPSVEVALDLFGNGGPGRPVTLALAHVVAVSENPAALERETPANVSPMRRARA